MLKNAEGYDPYNSADTNNKPEVVEGFDPETDYVQEELDRKTHNDEAKKYSTSIRIDGENVL